MLSDSLNNATSPFVTRPTTIILLLVTLLLSPNIRAQKYLQAFPTLPAIPLAVRSPYLNSWLNNNGNAFMNSPTWPTTFNCSQVCHVRVFSWPEKFSPLMCQVLGWSVLVRVDGLTYLFLGDVDPSLIHATVHSTTFLNKPSTTILAGYAGPMQVNLTFFNPIEVRSHSSLAFNVTI